MITTIIIFIIVLGVLVFVHEWGHFIVARKSGMKVDEFGFGFPPRMVGIQKTGVRWKWVWGHREPLDKDKTVYSINWIPFGGFVKILGENNEGENDPRSFINRPFWGRFLTLVAGVTMNWILAAVLFSLAFGIGVTSEIDLNDPTFRGAQVTDRQVAVAYVVPEQPAAKAGLMAGDMIVSIDGRQYEDYSQLRDYISANKGKTFDIKVKRLDQEKEFQVVSIANPPEGQGPTGVELTNVGKLKLPWYSAVTLGVKKAIYMTQAIFEGVFRIFTSKEAVKDVGGPLKIAQLTGQVASLGFVPLLNFTGLLSINLAILNILPIPALDGGRVLFLLIEKVRRKRNNQLLEQWVNTVGFVLLLALMVAVTAKDINGLGGIGHIFSKLLGK